MKELIASPGLAIVELLKEETPIITGGEQKGRIKRGKILAMGLNQRTDYGQFIVGNEYGKVGDIIYFLHYYESEGLDYVMADGKKIYFVRWTDFRGKEE